ncbi:MAG: hypothetical protein RL630_6 [Verrucomicrobiota bacterium]|jgi:tellurite resistance protein/uncharacterized protein (DUF697 family)
MKIDEALTPETADAFLAICLMAAMCDGEKSEVERSEIRRIAEELGSGDPSALSRKILMGRLSLDEVASRLSTPSQGLLAYEMALGVCESDGAFSPTEKQFLAEVSSALGLGAAESEKVAKDVESVVLAPVQSQPVPGSATAATTDNSGMILKYAILNGALELLPESLASMAILPMQMKMVYRIGKSHGVEMDRSRIKEFLTVAGVGLGSQMLEGFARKFLGGLGKKLGGKMVGKAANQVAGSAFSFGATYALGHLAEQYHQGGQRLDATSARNLFETLKSKASDLHSRHLPEIQAKARSITPSSILQMVSGQGPV